jgi:peptide/nickel transport system substrate-binding protein
MSRLLTVAFMAALLLSFAVALGQETPRQGGTAVVILGSDPEHLNPGISTGYPVGAVGASLYSALIRLDSEGMPQPELAEDWIISEDFLAYTFNLRAASWHDGEPVTSADVRFSMEEILAPNHGRFQTVFGFVESIETPDDTTVVINLSEPYAPLMSLLTVFDAPVLPQHIYAEGDPLTNPANQEPVGSGPFRFVEWNRGESITLERNPDYFLEPAHLERLIYRIIPQDVARSIALEVGEADLVWGFYLPTGDLPRLENNPSLEVWTGITIPSLYFVFVNTDNEQLADPLVRQALMHAIDREQIVDQAQAGLGEPAAGPFGLGFGFAYSEEADYRTLYPYDPDRAHELLQQAGVSNLQLDFLYDSSRGAFAAAAEIMRDNLRQVGVTLNVQPVERSVMVDRVYNRQYDLSMQSFTSGGDPAIGYHRIYLTAEAGTPFVNATSYSNPQVDDLLRQAATVADVDARAELYQQAAQIIAQDIPVLVLYNELSSEVSNRNLQGLRQALDPRDGLEFIWWSE